MNNNLMNALAQSQMNRQQGDQASPSHNPFNSGITKAIDSARASLGLNQQQKDDALRRSVLSFGQNLGAQPATKGFWANFAQVGKALNPAINAYSDAEADGLRENFALGKEIDDRRIADEATNAANDERMWQRGFAEKQHAETVRGHNLLDSFRRDKAKAEMGDVDENDPTRGMSKERKKAWNTAATQNHKQINDVISPKYNANSAAIPQLEEMKELLGTSKLSGSTPLAALKRKVANLTGTNEDELDIKNTGQYFIEWMNENNKGVMSDQDAKRFLETLPSIDKNPQASIRALDRVLTRLNNENDRYYKQLEAYQENPGGNLHNLDILKQPQKTKTAQTKVVKFRRPDTGKVIPVSKVELIEKFRSTPGMEEITEEIE
jgi:hypothetical protein